VSGEVNLKYASIGRFLEAEDDAVTHADAALCSIWYSQSATSSVLLSGLSKASQPLSTFSRLDDLPFESQVVIFS
jgi:hypothetical protein